MARMSQIAQLALVAEANSWLIVDRPFDFFQTTFIRGAEIVMVRAGRAGQVTALSVADGSGVILQVRTGKFREACVTLSAKEVNQHYVVSASNSAIGFCKCGQGFSGHQAIERLRAHIASPNPNSTAALLQKVMA